jgi:hypothetical protein
MEFSRQQCRALQLALGVAVEKETRVLEELRRMPRPKQTREVLIAIQQRDTLLRSYSALRRSLSRSTAGSGRPGRPAEGF